MRPRSLWAGLIPTAHFQTRVYAAFVTNNPPFAPACSVLWGSSASKLCSSIQISEDIRNIVQTGEIVNLCCHTGEQGSSTGEIVAGVLGALIGATGVIMGGMWWRKNKVPRDMVSVDRKTHLPETCACRSIALFTFCFYIHAPTSTALTIAVRVLIQHALCAHEWLQGAPSTTNQAGAESGLYFANAAYEVPGSAIDGNARGV